MCKPWFLQPDGSKIWGLSKVGEDRGAARIMGFLGSWLGCGEGECRGIGF